MKKIIITFILSLICSSLFNPIVVAETNKVDMSNWSYYMITDFSDQDDVVKVSKFTNSNGYVGFCLEPTIIFSANEYKYKKQTHDISDNIYNYTKAYNLLKDEDIDNNLYIATQLLIWFDVSNINYTFDGNDYGDYKKIIIDYINNGFSKTKNEIEIKEYVVDSDDDLTINEDLNEYEFSSNDIQIKQIDKDKIVLEILDKSKDELLIHFLPKEYYEYSNNYVSTGSKQINPYGSQDLYAYEGEYNLNKPFDLKIKIIHNTQIDINYSKKDIEGSNIEGAQFSLYELNESGDKLLTLIQKGSKIDLYEALNINNNDEIELSERYSKYFDGKYFKSNEIGYTDYKVNNNYVGRIYIIDNEELTNSTYKIHRYTNQIVAYSSGSNINKIGKANTTNNYLLCESEPKKGYTYVNNPCVFINTKEYEDEVYDFINDYRTYNLRLIKNNEDNIVLNGAKFKLTYSQDEEYKTKIFTTGSLIIDRIDNFKYLIYKHNNVNNVIEFNSDTFEIKDADTGRYYFYESNINDIDEDKFTNYVDVEKGGYIIKDLPYASKLTIEELQAPKGYHITDPIYEIYPDIKYSEITFSNYRVNEFEILPKRRIPKTCIDE